MKQENTMKNNELNTQELYRIAKTFKGLDELLAKYENLKERMLVMDDYDGGQMHMVDLIVRDLKNLKKPLDKSEKSGILRVWKLLNYE